jgi:glucose-1-phosphate cytidylyltransferase
LKVVILAGGLGTRLAEETETRPKPMVEIGGRPIIWHIMKIYSAYGMNDFIVCLGYKGYLIKEYFANYARHMSDVTVDMQKGAIEIHNNYAEAWRVTLIDTGDKTNTGGRLKRIREFVKDGDFCFTYGDGVSSVDVNALLAFHRAHGRLATVTAVMPPGRYGAMQIDSDRVADFLEKPQGDGGWINGGFFVLNPACIDFIDHDMTIWEQEPLQRLVAKNQLGAFKHVGFWQPMDTLRDKYFLERLWVSGEAPWKVW